MSNTALAKVSSVPGRVENKQLDALRRIATQATDPKEIRTRKGRGGMQLKYTDGAYVIRTLNNAFGWDWDFVADNEELLLNDGKPFEVKVRGTLTVRLNGQAVTKTQFGCQPIEMLKNGTAPVSIGDAYKGAATDAMKKCASLLGIALDLYDSDYRADTHLQGSYKYTNSSGDGRDEPEQQATPADILQDLNRQLGYDDAALLKWLTKKFGLSTKLTLATALDSLGDGEMSQAIDIFTQQKQEK